MKFVHQTCCLYALYPPWSRTGWNPISNRQVENKFKLMGLSNQQVLNKFKGTV